MKTHFLRVHRVCAAVFIALVALCTFPVRADPVADSKSGSQSDYLRHIVSSDRSTSRVQSVIFGAWLGDEPLLTVAEGDSISGEPATTAMHIRAGIVQTEALTTILVQLADRKRGLLDTPLATWFPSLRCAENVTLRMLANNRSGYGDYLADETLQKRLNRDPFEGFTPDELIAFGMKQPMPIRPGSGFFYSHTNAVLLGEALQRITGESVAELVRERITGPLHLVETDIPTGSVIAQPVQHLFYRDRGPFEDSTYWNPSWASHSGTMVSTIHDVAVMQRAFGRGTLVSKAGFAAILAPTNAKSPPQTSNFYYALGVIVGNTWILQHAQVAGSDVVMGYLPSRDLTIVVSTTIGFDSVPRGRGYSSLFFNDAAKYLAPERPIPSAFL